MIARHIILVGAPVDCGKRRRGCVMGPDAYRTAGLAEALDDLGHAVTDMGNLTPAPVVLTRDPDPKLFALRETLGWTVTLAQAAQDAAAQGLPIFLGGDHALSLGSVAGHGRPCGIAGAPAVRAVAGRAQRFPHPAIDRDRASARHAGGLCHRAARL